MNQSSVNRWSVNQPSVNQWSKDVLLTFLAVVLMSQLYACGFQLRGAVNLSKDMSPVFIDKNSYFDLAREIKDVLVSNGIQMVANAKSSKSQLVLLNENKTRSVLSVDGDGRAKEYLLTYLINFEIKRKLQGEDKFESKRDSISISRSLLFEPDAVLAAVNEADTIYKDMQGEAAGLILLKLQSFSDQMKAAEQKAQATDSGGVATPQPGSAPAETELEKPVNGQP